MTEYEALRAWITDRLKGSTFEQDDYDAILRIIKNSGILAQDSPWHRPVPLPTWWEQLRFSFDCALGVALDAAVREVTAERDRVQADPPAVVVFPPAATASGTALSPGIGTSFTASGSSPAEPKRGPLAGLSPSQKTVLVLVLVWVIAYFLPLAQMALPEVYQTLLTNAAAWWGIALAITYAILADRK